MSCVIDQRARWYLFALVVRDPDLAERHRAGGEIEHQRRPAAARIRGAERIGADTPVRSAERRDERIARYIDEVKRHESGARTLLGPVTDAANMMRTVQTYRADAETFRALDAELHRLIRDDLAEALDAVDGQHRAGVAHDLGVQIELQFVVAHRCHIARNHADAMRIVTGQARGEQVVGDQLGLARRAAGLLPDRPHIGM